MRMIPTKADTATAAGILALLEDDCAEACTVSGGGGNPTRDLRDGDCMQAVDICKNF